MPPCCAVTAETNLLKSAQDTVPILCLVPLDDLPKPKEERKRKSKSKNDFQLLDDEYIKKHFKLPSRPVYLDPDKRPLITYPMTQEDSNHFNMARKSKINQNILDGLLDSSEAISSLDVDEKPKKKKEEDDIIYILQLPDFEAQCPIHNQPIKTPRFIWHSCKNSEKKKCAPPGGVTKRPKPWLLSRHTDFDLMSQW